MRSISADAPLVSGIAADLRLERWAGAAPRDHRLLRAPAFAQRRSAGLVLGAATVLVLCITIARPLSVLRGTGRLMFPYEPMASEVVRIGQPPFAMIGDRPENAANIAIRLPSTAVLFDPRAPAERVLIAADNPARVAEVAQRLPAGYAPEGETRKLVHAFELRPERKAELAVQVWRRAAAGE